MIMEKEKFEKVQAIFKKYGGEITQSKLFKSMDITKQPDGLSTGFDGMCHFVTRYENELFQVSCVGTWTVLSGLREYYKQMTICLKVLEELEQLDSFLVSKKVIDV